MAKTSWPIKTLDEFFDSKPKSSESLRQKDYLSSGKFPVVDQGQELIGGFTNDQQLVRDFEIPVIVFGDHTRCVKYVDFPFASGADGTKILVPRKGVDPKYAYYQLLSIELPTKGYARHFGELSKRSFVLPPLDEQRRIVALLDAATARVTELRELGLRHSKLETEMQSAIVESLLAPQRGWDTRLLNEWCSEIGTGPFGSLVHKADYVETGIPLVNPMNMKEGQIVESDIKRVSPSKAVELNRYILKTGDIVLGRRGEMGRCAVVRSEHDGWICGTGSFFLRPNEDCSPDLLALWLSSRQGRSALCSISSGTTMDNLGNRELGLLQVAFPDRPTQDDVVSRASALEGLVSEMQIQQHDRSLLLESLQQSILEAAFAGAL